MFASSDLEESRTVKIVEHAVTRVAHEELCKEEGNASAGNYPSVVVSFDFSSFVVNPNVIRWNPCAFMPYTLCCHRSWTQGFVKHESYMQTQCMPPANAQTPHEK